MKYYNVNCIGFNIMVFDFVLIKFRKRNLPFCGKQCNNLQFIARRTQYSRPFATAFGDV